MGAWGYGLLDNDDVCDKLCNVSKYATERLKKLFNKRKIDSQERFERVGMLFGCYKMEGISFYLEQSQILYAGLRDIDYLVEDLDWLESWKDRGKTTRKHLLNFKKQILKDFPFLYGKN